MSIAFIPARGGSKGLPGKNKKLFLGEPLIQRTIRIAIESEVFNRIIVNTDDDEIASLAKEKSVEILRRPAELGNDTAEVDPLIQWSINKLGIDTQSHEVMALLYCTAPLREAKNISDTVKLITNREFDSALTLVETNDYLWQRHEGSFFPTNYDPKSRAARQNENWNQYKENKAVYAFKVRDIMATGCRLTGRIGGILMAADRSIDIDTIEEFRIAEAIELSHLQSKAQSQ